MLAAAHDIETLNKILKVNKLAASKTHPMFNPSDVFL